MSTISAIQQGVVEPLAARQNARPAPKTQSDQTAAPAAGVDSANSSAPSGGTGSTKASVSGPNPHLVVNPLYSKTILEILDASGHIVTQIPSQAAVRRYEEAAHVQAAASTAAASGNPLNS